MDLKKHIKIIILCLILPVIFSCVKEFKDIPDAQLNISPEFGLPIAKGNLTLSEVFKPDEDSSMFLYPGEDGILHLIFKQNIDTLEIDELMSDLMGDQLLLNDSITLPRVSNGVSISSPETYFNLHLDSILQEQQVDSLLLNSGIIEFDFKTWENYDSKFSITLPNLCDSEGENIRILDFVPTAENHKITFNLENGKLKINSSENSKGIFTVQLGYNIMGKSTDNNIHDPTISFKMFNFDINSAYGKLGGFSIDLDPIYIDLFSENPLGEQVIELDLGEPQINLLFLNQFGFPFSFEFTQIGFIKDGAFEEITGVPKSILVEAPPLGSENEFTTTVFEIDPNSNLDQLASKFPQQMVIDGQFEINPNDPNAYNFIREQDIMISRVEADIPLSFRLTQIGLDDTTSLNLSSLENLEDNLELIKLQTKIKNDFPFELDMQAYFADENYIILDSLFNEPIHILGSEFTEIPAESNIWVDKTNAQIRTLKGCKHLISNAYFYTRDSNSGEIVDFYSGQGLEIEITGFAKINF
ncbi:MAG: hypothetical protein HN778_07340 [Prolixibacteraceae bacterium]|nr:hypothetical protein [Prolixibacteraceae bacterium]MBT6005294.1 hypothetical protein [Prolixibacteraceae bacterium]MBT6764918.1 hypothetical protein [Prolixibacteraceae bacterium]MBT6998094.1 hypothetical protein [Prolixibacteraceae bacterium]MBT7394632.1 hypothetical protein [Prolixibacteraceae bacterium]